MTNFLLSLTIASKNAFILDCLTTLPIKKPESVFLLTIHSKIELFAHSAKLRWNV